MGSLPTTSKYGAVYPAAHTSGRRRPDDTKANLSTASVWCNEEGGMRGAAVSTAAAGMQGSGISTHG